MRTEPEPSAAGAPPDYVQRTNRAIDHVLAHLDEPLRLESVAAAAGFSPFHFHRVFKALTGETLQRFVKRVRLERAVSLMTRAPDRSLTEIALACGFGSSSDFSRSFKQHFGVPPSAFDVETFRAARRERWTGAVTDAASEAASGDAVLPRLERLPPGANPDGFTATLRRLPPRTVAYVRVPDPYRGGVPEAAERLVAWAEARGCAGGRWLGYMWDDPDVVAHEDCRYDVGVEVDDVRPEGEVGRLDFPAMLVAEVEVVGSIELEQRALDWLFGTWLPSSGYAPADLPGFEVWRGRPFEDGFEHFELDLHLPVERF